MPKMKRQSVLTNANLEYLDQAMLADPHMTSEEDRKRILELTLRADRHLIAAMKGVRSLHLPDWCVSGTSIVWPLWAAFLGKPSSTGNHHLNISYYDTSDRALQKEMTYLRHIRQILSASPYQVHLRNQAGNSMPENQGQLSNCASVTCTAESLLKDPVETYAVGARLENDGQLTLLAPLGLSGIYAMKMKRNKTCCDEELFLCKLARVEAMWPEFSFT